VSLGSPGGDDACPLCGAGDLRDRGRAFGRRFRECPCCRLLSMHPGDHPSSEEERRRYRLHRNDPDDAGYRAFLERLWRPVADLLPAGARGIDYGCGPVPVLAHLARVGGFACDAFDPLFHPNPPRPRYDFVLASEVFEHFRVPAREIPRVASLLDSGGPGCQGGLLAVMTLHWRDGEDLARWHYLSDPTHLSLYRAETFDWIAVRYGLCVEWSDGERVVVLRKKAHPGSTGRNAERLGDGDSLPGRFRPSAGSPVIRNDRSSTELGRRSSSWGGTPPSLRRRSDSGQPLGV
jgi:hypothetical protein